MSGGTWEKQDKLIAGAYVNFKSKKNEESNINERGIVGLPLVLPFGPEKKIIEIDNETDVLNTIGIENSDRSILMLQEALKKAKKVLLYRLNDGVKANKTLGGLTITSKWSGSKGNEIRVVIQTNIYDETAFDITTFLGETRVDIQTVKNIEDLTNNIFVEFTGTGALTLSAGIKLEGGEDKVATGKDYSEFLKELELYDFNTVAIPYDDKSTKLVVKEFVKRLRENEGRKVQAILPNFADADYEGIISVKNGVYIKDNIHVGNIEATAYVAALTASSGYSQSNTYAVYEGAVNVDARYSDSDIKQIIKNGEIIFITNNKKVLIEQDINTLKDFTDDKKSDFRKNRVVRVLDGINDLIKNKWEENYIGKVSNNEDGRNLFKKDVLNILETLQAQGALENVTVEDIEVYSGNSKDAIVVNVNAQPIDSMEKIYMTVFI
ncbi:phage tail sheath family protein [Clostridium weizhouense]|uniref:Phage tail sheath family protein n=1 Tax=Clostridium weizhouense TaxID=2859781 RepID=A0ABS7AIW5_9CLOT|nr:phage tail sheath family protein [Clostridium weizhouense]MBW6408484.1 phage tail sheath family protein [Clostridium weizhouense]